MGDDGTEDTSDVTGDKGDTELLGLVVLGARLGEGVLVDGLDGLLKGGELHHGVGDLTEPEGSETLVEAVGTLGLEDLVEASDGAGGKGGGGGLHLDLQGLHGAKGNIGQELSGSGGGEEDKGVVLAEVLLADGVSILLLEELVETVLGGTLHAVPEEGRAPTGVETGDTLSLTNGPPAVEDALVESRIDLTTALDEIKGSDKSVGETTGGSTTNSTHVVELARVQLNGGAGREGSALLSHGGSGEGGGVGLEGLVSLGGGEDTGHDASRKLWFVRGGGEGAEVEEEKEKEPRVRAGGRGMGWDGDLVVVCRK